MKRIVATIGVAALGAAFVQTASAQGDGSKPWSASVALRGFYDDNINTTKNDTVETFGWQVSPSLALLLRGDQTTLSLAYTYDFKYYDTKPTFNADNNDQTHTLAASLLHTFNERTAVTLSESFVVGQEADILRVGPDYASFQRIPGNNIRNYASATLNHQFTPKIGMELGYGNSLFDYKDDVYQEYFFPGGYPLGVNPVSRSGILDRMEQTVHLDGRWTIQPNTIGVLGYAFGVLDYTADQPIGVIYGQNISQNSWVYSDDRNSRSHYLYAGADQTFLPNLHGKLRAGARIVDYVNSPANESGVAPYVLASLTYDYSRGNVQVGFSHDLSATDAFSIDENTGSITTDSAVTVVYTSLTYNILPKLTGTLLGEFQNSTFRGGSLDDQSEQYYLVSTALSYQFNRHIAASVSYHYDFVDSNADNRGFDRNRVFLGATFTY